MYLVNKVGRSTDAQSRSSSVNIIEPFVELLIGFEGNPSRTTVGLDFEAEWLDVDALDVGNVFELDEGCR